MDSALVQISGVSLNKKSRNLLEFAFMLLCFKVLLRTMGCSGSGPKRSCHKSLFAMIIAKGLSVLVPGAGLKFYAGEFLCPLK